MAALRSIVALLTCSLGASSAESRCPMPAICSGDSGSMPIFDRYSGPLATWPGSRECPASPRGPDERRLDGIAERAEQLRSHRHALRQVPVERLGHRLHEVRLAELTQRLAEHEAAALPKRVRADGYGGSALHRNRHPRRVH